MFTLSSRNIGKHVRVCKRKSEELRCGCILNQTTNIVVNSPVHIRDHFT